MLVQTHVLPVNYEINFEVGQLYGCVSKGGWECKCVGHSHICIFYAHMHACTRSWVHASMSAC